MSTSDSGEDPALAARLLAAQRAAFLAEGGADVATRLDRLDRAIELLVRHEAELCAAAAGDFAQRPASLTQLMDVFPAVHALRFARRNVRRWMKPRRRRLGLPLGVPGARGEVVFQPLGIVGLVSPWNFPVTLSFGPLAGILAAGNRALVKPSELTPRVSELLQSLVARHFDPCELAVVTGGVEVAREFAQLPFDHLLFTGSTAVGASVMTAAARNLVPVTLELGGKCPVLIGRSADLARAVDRILIGKLANAGQMCLAPDFVYVPQELRDAFVSAARSWVSRAYPGLPENPDYTAIVSAHHAERVLELLADARAKGATIIPLGEAAPRPAEPRSRLIAPALILGATADMRVMREEIFAPLLPLCAYERFETVIAELASRPRPLALYYFGRDRAEERAILHRTRSGAVTVNDVAVHFLAEELPFGGVGESGMGSYHGEYGFQRFSHARAVFHQSRLDLAGLTGLRPPYGRRLERVLRLMIRR
ncbi:MAG TPA: aldehyde dehydrogenase family protein [Steroidobacteraceae bacterium]|nr:aldehyde dehydrogenase family protein [Steroidobacteraceae bacterium]